MATQVQWRRGTTAQCNAFTGAVGEVVVDTQTHQLVVQDGLTAGGYRTGLATGGTFNNVTLTGTLTYSAVTASGTVTSTVTTTGGTYANPSLTGTATAPTKALPDASTAIATTAFVQNAVQFYAPLNLAIASAMVIANFNSPSGT